MSLISGFAAVNQAIEKSAEQGQGGGFLRTLLWKDDRSDKGELYQHTVRFLTDDVIPCKIYEFIPCKDGKMRDFIVPSSVGLEGPDVIQELGIKVPQYGNKNNLIEPKARDMTFGLVIVREEKAEMVNGRRVLTYEDKMEEVSYEKDGEKIEETRPMFRIVKQSNRNFWGMMIGYHSRYGTVTDRDYSIERKRNDKDTSYVIIPCDPIEGLRDPEDIAKAYNPPTTLENVIKDLASPERARRLLTGETSESKGEGSDKPAASTGSSEESDDSQFSDFRKKLLDQS